MIDYVMCQDIDILIKTLDFVDVLEQILVKLDDDYYVVKGYWRNGNIVLEHSAGYIDIDKISMFNILK